MEKYALGIDIGGTGTKIGIINNKGECISFERLNTSSYNKIENFVSDCVDCIKIMIENSEIENPISGLGIGAPSGNYYTGNIEDAPNLKWGKNIPLSKMFEDALNIPVKLTNDANAAAFGEMIFGGAKNMKDFLLITLGTGLGSGFVSNGNLIYGHDGFAGEIGHITYDKNGRPCGCGKEGCLEKYVSASGLRTTYLELKSLDPKTYITSKSIADKANAGDKIALQSFEITGRILGEKLADIITITSPEAIFLTGGLALSGSLIFDPVKSHFEENLMNIFKNKIQILPSKLPDAYSAILGAAALVL